MAEVGENGTFNRLFNRLFRDVSEVVSIMAEVGENGTLVCGCTWLHITNDFANILLPPSDGIT